MAAWVLMLAALAHTAFKSTAQQGGILYPRESETRDVKTLDGIWNFVLSPITDPLEGFNRKWYKTPLKTIPNVEVYMMPVPSSYNDITLEEKIRDHVGVVWYERSFFVPSAWNNTRVWMRFSSVSYAAQVWINGELVMNHEIGHLPFQGEISKVLKFGASNRVTVACDNTLLSDTVPQGTVTEVQTDEGIKLEQSYSFDFMNYAGIHRPVTLFTTPFSYIDDVTVFTSIKDGVGVVSYNISHIANDEVAVKVHLYDKAGGLVVSYGSPTGSGSLEVPKAKLWWPYLMDPNPGYLYTLRIELQSSSGEILDVYRQPVGIRTITWTNSSLLMNNRPLYLHGFGRHEDSDIRGKGLDFPTVLRDHYLIKWVGGNAYRTSHYPYADEIMDLADELGIMIIDECPSVNTEVFSYALLEKHKTSLTELIKRDKNRPSVIAWSLANEPRSTYNGADEYFRAIAEHVKSLDTTRPTTIAISFDVNSDQAGKHIDIISFNRYNGWYVNPGKLDMITQNIINEATEWREKHNKPVLLSEYGADTMIGLHLYPAYVWSEEYQVKLMSRHFQAFDYLREQGWFIGEFIWNMADFKTAQIYTRVGGNRKGIFTRDRQPKASAFHLRRRYHHLAKVLYNCTPPADLYDYVLAIPSTEHDEL